MKAHQHDRWKDTPAGGSTFGKGIGPSGRCRSCRFVFWTCLVPLTLCSSLLISRAAAATADSLRVTGGPALITLNGPWRFHTGDDPLWADPNFDDSGWQTVDLTPPPGAHDSDVGLTGYVPGWQASGHRGYAGYGWYRIRVSVKALQPEALALCGPFYVDSAYQVLVNGRLLGGMGNFSGETPVAYSMHRPKIFPLPPSLEPASSHHPDAPLVAIRVWMGPWALQSAETGGIHIAPAIGATSGAESLYRQQWQQLIRGYIVDAVEGLLFVLLAVMALSLIPLDRSNRAYLWLAAALILLGLARANQAIFSWGQFETVHGFELATIVLLVPLSLATWTMAWRTWLRVGARRYRGPHRALHRSGVAAPLVVLRRVPAVAGCGSPFLFHVSAITVRAPDIAHHSSGHIFERT